MTLAIGLAILTLILAASLRPRQQGVTDLSGPVVIGIALSMVEPGFPFGAFFLSVPFWLVLVLQLRSSAFDRPQKPHFQ